MGKVQNLAPTVKHGGGGVMVWGCIAASGVGNLVFIESTMDHKMYINILKKIYIKAPRNWDWRMTFGSNRTTTRSIVS